MNQIQIRDKKFIISITADKIRSRIKEVAAKISTDLEGKKPLFLAVLNGSFVFAADLLRALTIDCEISFIKISSYEGTASSGNAKRLIGINESLIGRTVVILEDIIDSGLTMVDILNMLEKENVAEVKIATLLIKPNNLKAKLDIDYFCFKIPNDFIVGYGLDYDGEGRNLDAIYTIAD